MRTTLPLMASALVLGCGPAIDEAALRREIRDDVVAELEANRSRRNESIHAEAAPAEGAHAEGTAPLALPEVERIRMEPGRSPWRGAEQPLVTIVEFADYQCPFCSRVESTLQRLLREFPDEVRIVFRNNPLPFHQQALPAAEAALEAYEQGGNAMFWTMHSLLYENQRALERANLEDYARQAGMDVTALGAALDDHRHRARIETDQAATTRAGARGTPAFFINGIQLMGAQPYERFAEVVREEIATARAIERSGVPRAAIYARLMENAVPSSERDRPEDEPPPPRRRPDPAAVYHVPVTGRPASGPSDALVTIVEYGEFQCPFCGRVQSTLAELQRNHGADVRIVFRHNPLPFHDNAMPAAEAAEEVFTQLGSAGFFRYAELLFTNQRQLDQASLLTYAAQVGARRTDVEAALRDHRHQDTIRADQALARALGASGTPAFFINGRNLRGAQPLPAFTALIDEERRRAQALLQSGTPRAGLYDALIAGGAESPQWVEGGAPPAAAPSPPPDQVYTIPVPRRAPTRGPARAAVVIQLFSDFQCPFCSRLPPTLDQIVQRYGRQVRIVWRDYPLPFHQNAMPAAEAAREVFAQGGDRAFWRYHDLLFENQQNLTEDELVRLAGTIRGVREARVRRALSTHRHRAAVQADMQAIQDAGARIGTPSCFVNGRLIQGAQPFSAFEAAIDRELARRP